MLPITTAALIQNGYFLKLPFSQEDIGRLFQIDEIIVKKDSSLLAVFDGHFKLEFGFFKNKINYFSVEPYADSTIKNVFEDDLHLFNKSQSTIANYISLVKINEEQYDYKNLSFYFDNEKKLTAIFQKF